MDEIRVSAQFAAFLWHREVASTSHLGNSEQERAATRFAKAAWQSFLPFANPGLGKLLKRLARPQTAIRRPSRLLARREAS